MLVPVPLRDPTPAGRFACIIDNLCATLAARMAKHPAMPLLMLAWTRLRRAAARFTRLAARLDAGPLPQRPRSPRPPKLRPPKLRPPNPRPPPALRLPGGWSWLTRLVPEASPFGSQLQHLLSQPDMQALLATAPQAARIFRPLCRALGAQPHPPLPKPPRPATAATKPAARRRTKPPAKSHPPTRERWPSPGLGSFILPKPART